MFQTAYPYPAPCEEQRNTTHFQLSSERDPTRWLWEVNCHWLELLGSGLKWMLYRTEASKDSASRRMHHGAADKVPGEYLMLCRGVIQNVIDYQLSLCFTSTVSISESCLLASAMPHVITSMGNVDANSQQGEALFCP
ncbi:uncharacterized protein GJ701_006744 [Geothlypis trichas]